MPSTPLFGFPYPAETGVLPDVPADMQALALGVETYLKRYSRTMSFSVSIPDSANTAIGTFTTIQEMNRPTLNPFASGIFTAPTAGLHAVFLFVNGVTGANRTSARLRLNPSGGGFGELAVNDDTIAGGAGRASAAVPAWYLALGDQIEWSLYQNSGGTVTMTGYAAIAQIG